MCVTGSLDTRGIYLLIFAVNQSVVFYFSTDILFFLMFVYPWSLQLSMFIFKFCLLSLIKNIYKGRLNFLNVKVPRLRDWSLDLVWVWCHHLRVLEFMVWYPTSLKKCLRGPLSFNRQTHKFLKIENKIQFKNEKLKQSY